MIITNNEDILRVNCTDASLDEAVEIIIFLELELIKSNKCGKPGIGLSAPQIGINKRVAIVRSPDENINLVNCKIEKAYDQGLFKREGCLSFPDQHIDTIRYNEVYVVNNLVYPSSFVVSDLASVVVQHEIGHWNKDLFFDHKQQKMQPFVRPKKIGPNELCICGKRDGVSGKIKKYKKCCGINR